MITATTTPIKATDEIDLSAGCSAKINAPMAKIVVITANKIEVR